MTNTSNLFTADTLYLTDGGLETSLIFHDGIELPEFAAYTLLDHPYGKERLRAYYQRYIDLAVAQNSGFVLESPTWRASLKWARRLGQDEADVERLNRDAIDLMAYLRDSNRSADIPMLVSGCIGPEDDGYSPETRMSVAEAHRYHTTQARVFAEAGADMVTAVTMTYAEEAIGIANAAHDAGLPSVISFTVETDGRLPVGTPLDEAIARVDAEASQAPAYYMLNCAHPDHFHLPLEAAWLERIGGVRANASRMSHAELDDSETLDDGNPAEFGQLHAGLMNVLPNLKVVGGCCGTDHRHVESVAHNCL